MEKPPSRTPRLRPVKGTFKVRESAAPIPHEEGFRAAIDNALKKTHWPKGDHANVAVELTVTVRVVNPGHIVEYGAKLVPSG
jgi:hypothetical protein